MFAAARRPKLSKRVYLHLKFGKPPPFELIKWDLIKRFHWTPADVDALSVGDWHELIQVDDGIAKAGNNGTTSSKFIR